MGLALSYAAPVVSLLNGFLTTFTETEKEMIAVERVAEVKSIISVLILIYHVSLAITMQWYLQYVGIPQEELQGFESPSRSWPTEGRIDFVHVTLRYKPELPLALDDVSFHIAPGMQVQY